MTATCSPVLSNNKNIETAPPGEGVRTLNPSRSLNLSSEHAGKISTPKYPATSTRCYLSRKYLIKVKLHGEDDGLIISTLHMLLRIPKTSFISQGIRLSKQLPQLSGCAINSRFFFDDIMLFLIFYSLVYLE